MNVEATTQGPLDTDSDTIVVGVFEQEGVAHDVPSGALTALLKSGEARTELGRVALTHAEDRRFILVGLGARTEFAPERARVAAAKAHARALELRARSLCWELPHHVPDTIAAALVHGTVLHAYRFDRYKPAGEASSLSRLMVSAHHDVSRAVQVAAVLAAAQNRARDLGNTPANDLTPTALADYAAAAADRLEGLSVTVLGETRDPRSGHGRVCRGGPGLRPGGAADHAAL